MIRRKKQDKYNLMVLKLLKELSKRKEVRLSEREISRVLKINHMAVCRAIKKLMPILDIKRGSDFENFRLPVYLIRLKDSVKDLPLKTLMKKIRLSEKMMEEIYRRG